MSIKLQYATADRDDHLSIQMLHRLCIGKSYSYVELSSFEEDHGIMLLMSMTGHRSFFHRPRAPRSSRTMNLLWNATIIHIVTIVRGNIVSKKRANVVCPWGLSSVTFIPKAFCVYTIINHMFFCHVIIVHVQQRKTQVERSW